MHLKRNPSCSTFSKHILGGSVSVRRYTNTGADWTAILTGNGTKVTYQ
jgi:hypothetical protein